MNTGVRCFGFLRGRIGVRVRGLGGVFGLGVGGFRLFGGLLRERGLGGLLEWKMVGE